MDLTQLANLGECIGGVAVLVTLIYLASQVRQSNTWNKQQGLRHLKVSEDDSAGHRPKTETAPHETHVVETTTPES